MKNSWVASVLTRASKCQNCIRGGEIRLQPLREDAPLPFLRGLILISLDMVFLNMVLSSLRQKI